MEKVFEGSFFRPFPTQIPLCGGPSKCRDPRAWDLMEVEEGGSLRSGDISHGETSRNESGRIELPWGFGGAQDMGTGNGGAKSQRLVGFLIGLFFF